MESDGADSGQLHGASVNRHLANGQIHAAASPSSRSAELRHANRAVIQDSLALDDGDSPGEHQGLTPVARVARVSLGQSERASRSLARYAKRNHWKGVLH